MSTNNKVQAAKVASMVPPEVHKQTLGGVEYVKNVAVLECCNAMPCQLHR
jgi:hypothetical protein